MPKIREATIEDADQINLISAQLGYQKSTDEEAEKRLREILESTSDYIWIYHEDRKLKGWIHLFVSIRLASSGFAEIGGLVVDKSCRRSGIGRKLVEQARQWSKINNMPVRVRCNANREVANRFYQSIGFDCLKTQKIHQLRP